MIIVSPASRRMGERGGAAGYMSRSLPATSGILTVKICQIAEAEREPAHIQNAL